MGLATPAGPGEWTVGLEAERSLRDLGMRGDIIKTMHRAFTERGQDRGIADYVIDSGAAGSPVVGRLVDGGLQNELASEAYAIVNAPTAARTTSASTLATSLASCECG
jgi:type IV secretory pathway VirD2 relaxase